MENIKFIYIALFCVHDLILFVYYLVEDLNLPKCEEEDSMKIEEEKEEEKENVEFKKK